MGKTLSGFDVAPTIPLVVGDDPRTCADAVRAYAALYLGGMGSRQQNFYNALAVRMGFEEAAATVQDLFLTGRQRDARGRCRTSSSIDLAAGRPFADR